MENAKDYIQKEFEKIWPKAKKNITKVNKDLTKLMKRSEKNLIDVYSNVKKKTEAVIMRAKREELYYELGKNVTPLLTSDQLKNKNVLEIYSQIQQLSKKLRNKK
jgi:predicted transcriptional regulator